MVSKMIEEGKKAPSFCLLNKDVKEVCLADFYGMWVVVYFYPRDNTPGCTREARDFTKKLATFTALHAVVIGISTDSPASHQNFVDKHILQQILLSDEQHTALQAYGVWQKKKMYGKSFYGIVRSTVLVDPDGIIAAWWPKVRVAGHVDEVLETLKGLRA